MDNIRYLPLTDEIVSILEMQISNKRQDDFVFPSPNGLCIDARMLQSSSIYLLFFRIHGQGSTLRGYIKITRADKKREKHLPRILTGKLERMSRLKPSPLFINNWSNPFVKM
jgi:hypothetical protein